MEKTAMKVFLACAFGAFIGSMVALQLNHYFWWLGLIIGGFAGYLTYDFKKVISAIPRAYKAIKMRRKIVKEGALETASVLLAFSSLVAPIGVMEFMSSYLLFPLSGAIRAFVAFVGIMAVILGLIIAMRRFNYGDDVMERIKVLIKHCNPIFLYIIVPLLIFKEIPGAMLGLAKFVGKFFKTLFFLIHSDIRLLCATDATIGTAIGYFSGNAIIGAIAGGVFGVINYKVVSRHILHLHPKT